MYQVLYRKWRPEKFSDVSGQPQVTKTLKNEIKNGRINHAYLFTGSRGTGKTTCAKILAKAVNCLDSHDGEPCGKCQNCVDFQEGNLLDVVEMDAASNRGIEDIRVLIEESAFSPSKGKYRVYIIDEVHMLTEPAFNALLKTLEEPPAHVVFILATTEVHKLPQTILSRCQRFDFHRIAPEDIAERLMYVAQQENVIITKEAALLTAVIADGAMRDSLSIMDRCIGISRDIDADVVRKAAGLAQKDYLFSLSSACINKNVQKALSIIDKLHSESMDMARLCAELIDHFRNFMLIKTIRNPREMIVMNDDEFEQAQSQCDYVSLADVVYFMDVLQRSAERMGKSSSNRTEMETALVKLTSPELDMSQEALTARLVKLEKAVNMGGFSKASNTTQNNDTSNKEDIEKSDLVNKKEENSVPDRIEETPQQNNAPVFPNIETTATANDLHNKLEEMRSKLAIKEEEAKNQYSEPVSNNGSSVPFPTIEDSGAPIQENIPAKRNPVNLEEIYANAEPFLRWQEVVENLKEYSRPIAASFDNTDAYVSGDYLLIDAKTDIPFNLLKRSPEQKDRIRDAVQEMTGKRYKLGPYKPPVKKQEKTDPLATFAQKLKDSGVEVTEE
ncbi:MAG: DNA polymerase III subunit gamma/tau [Oscillospiraceae bacterium]|nr:DNA polymerase III subunit gamma/tau [Oscillospiraceae bacterium]